MPYINTDKVKPYTKAEKAFISRFASTTSALKDQQDQKPLSYDISPNNNKVTSKITLADAVSVNANESGIESNNLGNKKKRQKFKIS